MISVDSSSQEGDLNKNDVEESEHHPRLEDESTNLSDDSLCEDYECHGAFFRHRDTEDSKSNTSQRENDHDEEQSSRSETSLREMQ